MAVAHPPVPNPIEAPAGIAMPRGFMRTKRARVMGFCHGVRKAFDNAVAVADAHTQGRPLVLSGDIVHNADVVNFVREKGIEVMGAPDQVQDSTVLIRTHGATRQAMELLEANRNEIIDLTCGIVIKAHDAAKELQTRHPMVVITGKKQHPEVVGALSYLDFAFAVESEEDIEALPKVTPDGRKVKSVGVVTQTTFGADKFHKIMGLLLTKYGRVEAIDTVCDYTEVNQGTSLELAREADVMLVVGGTNSSNSLELFRVVEAANPRTHFLQNADQIDAAWFNAGDQLVGITAGASTPEWIIRAIEERVEAMVPSEVG
ncbi:MAG TPA: 4-hydroxy-3-methylbut-2-enyl diphosphate reductase [bacterium]|nr:4-hydroxy-3-methylbut-2-enyl diphosphate reductase [bacterium]